jgi:hypothetical protein
MAHEPRSNLTKVRMSLPRAPADWTFRLVAVPKFEDPLPDET